MKNWISRFGAAYPFDENWSSFLKNAMIALVVVSLFLYFVQPFGTKIPPGGEFGYLGICLGYGMVSAAVILLVGASMKLFSTFFKEKKWTLGKEILLQIGIISFVGTGNLFYANQLWSHDLSFSNWLEWQKMTAIVAFAPIAVTAFLRQKNLQNRFETEAAALEKSLPLKTQLVYNERVSSKKIVLTGDNQGERLEFERRDFQFIEAADNYVEVHFLNQEKAATKLLRGTLKKMEDQLAEHQNLLRCHRAFLVDLDKVKRVSGNAQGYKLHLEGCAEPIPVSRNLNQMVAERLKKSV